MIAMIAVKEFGSEMQYIRFINGDSANLAIKLLRKQPNVRWAIRLSDVPRVERPDYSRYSGDVELAALLMR